ncbi:MAG: class I SAM-dependent methyltransferase [Xanthomonadaceae bacterium]|nr:class I SAM-dependent methyltransferase [Xanthomonadaceae bacterium]
MTSRFDPEFYSLYRPLYPPETFAGLESDLLKRGFSPPYQIADIGCGTGHSTVSLLKTGIEARVIGVDPDQKMLDVAGIESQLGSGEKTGLESQSIEAIIVGSAFHWMNPEKTKTEFLRILKPRGVVRIFEYQFPKAPALPELNEWIRCEFNLRWKAPDQKPRGSLKELTRVFRDDTRFEWIGEGQPEMKIKLNSEQLTGLILSQSRVLHYEDTLSAEERESFRKSLRIEIQKHLHDRSEIFDFKLSWVNFSRN